MTRNVIIIDSGAGGLSILNSIRKRSPQLNLHYFADSLYAPYGDKSSAFLNDRLNQIATLIEAFEDPLHAVVVACNTATVEAIDVLRERLSIPVIGVEPAVKPALNSSNTDRVSVLATPITIRSNRLKDLIRSWQKDKMVQLISSQSLAKLIDSCSSKKCEHLEEEVGKVCSEVLQFQSQALVLACTHYPLIREMFLSYLPGVAIVEPSSGVTDQLLRRLGESGFDGGALGAIGAITDVGSLGQTILNTSGNESDLDALLHWCEDENAVKGRHNLAL